MESIYSDVTPGDDWTPSKRYRLFAWLTHVFTATGAVWGLMGIISIAQHQWMWAFVWMAAAAFVDAFDGMLARRARVKEVVPEFDGALLDNMVDFLNYVIVPAFFILEYGFLPERYALVGVFLLVLASTYQFCQSDAKTDDHYFKGFPSYWNVLVFYLFLLNLAAWTNFVIVVVLAILVFVPIKYVYPSRTERYQRLTLPLAIIWGIVCVIILIQYPNQNPWLIWISLLYALYYVGISLYSMITYTN
ncbi:CDP-alcohol phosphatidyltransferase family protein [Chloroflexi bacterium TSY]|nr:CDP-alcohol phosphatidyltransferase family protein [Chloroflexi bacterium TSY]